MLSIILFFRAVVMVVLQQTIPGEGAVSIPRRQRQRQQWQRATTVMRTRTAGLTRVHRASHLDRLL